MGFSRRRPGQVVFLLAAASLLSVLAFAQTQTSAPPLAKINVLVLDRQNRPVRGLKQEDFHLAEDGKPVTVSFFSHEEVPLSYGLVIDTSGSLRSQISEVILAAQTIVNDNKPEDETFIVRFVDRANIVTEKEFTRNKSELLSALDSLYVKEGQTALVDAVYKAAEYLNNHQTNNARRALILITDGEERMSYYTKAKLFEYLRATDMQVFIIGLTLKLYKDVGPGIKSQRQAAEELLDRLAKETGGRAFYPKDVKEVQDVADEIMLDLRSQYVIGFVPNSPSKSGEYRKVEVKVTSPDDKNKLKVITRGGYLSP
jgi:Ca-activated chloride channel family protein